MPIHDWTRVDAGIFHHFHHEWISEISRTLNQVLQGTDFFALAEQVAGGLGPDVLTLQLPPRSPKAKAPAGAGRRSGIVLATSPPKTRFRITNPPRWYATKKKAVTVRHVSEHRVVAVLEIVSPGNKAAQSALAMFVRKAQDLLSAGIHLDFVDLFPPTPRDPEGLHPIVWGDEKPDDFLFDASKPLTCAAYVGGPGAQAFVEPLAVGDELPELPLFLTPDEYIDVPLESTYQAAFDAVPEVWRDVLANTA